MSENPDLNSEATATCESCAPYFVAYAVGLVHASVCTNLADDEAVARLNREQPTGIASPWQIDPDKVFATGQTNPCPCPDLPDCRHILFNC